MNGDFPKLYRIVYNFMAKTAQVIAQARLIPAEFGNAFETPNRWFNLELRELESVHNEIRWWRSSVEAGAAAPPLVIEVTLNVPPLQSGHRLVSVGESGQKHVVDSSCVILESWILKFHRGLQKEIDVPVTYKRSVVSMRVLWTLVRQMPVWALRDRILKGHENVLSLKIGFRIKSASSSLGQNNVATRSLAPIETSVGKLYVDVTYLKHVDFSIEADIAATNKDLSKTQHRHEEEDQMISVAPLAISPQFSIKPFRDSPPRQQVRPMPVPPAKNPVKAATPTSAGSGASSNARFSSSFARTSQINVAHPRYSSVTSVIGSASSGGSSLEPATDIYLAHNNMNDFLNSIEIAQNQARDIFQGSTDIDSQLLKFQSLRGPQEQFSDQVLASLSIRRKDATASAHWSPRICPTRPDRPDSPHTPSSNLRIRKQPNTSPESSASPASKLVQSTKQKSPEHLSRPALAVSNESSNAGQKSKTERRSSLARLGFYAKVASKDEQPEDNWEDEPVFTMSDFSGS